MDRQTNRYSSNNNQKPKDTLTPNRIPPQSLEMEISVLGSILLDQEAMLKVLDILKPEDFYKEANGIIFEGMLDLYAQREPIDLLSLANKLQQKNQLDLIGGEEYLASLVEGVPTSAHVDHYARQVAHKSTLRKLISVGSEIVELGFMEDGQLDEILNQAEHKVFSVSQKFVKQDFVHIQSALEDAFDRIEHVHEKGAGLKGVSTGFHALDNSTGGLQGSNLIILAARPSVGKTSFALDIGKQVALTAGKPVVFFSLEMSKEEVVDRLLSSEARVDLFKMKTGKLARDDFERIAFAMDTLSRADFFIDDTPGMNVMKMRAILRRITAESKGIGLIIIDYLQLMESTSRSDNVVQQVSEISRSLKGLAREFDVPVIALSQLSRSVENRSPQIPRLSDLRESGSIEQDADIVFFIYREERENPETERKGIAEIHIAKQRNGPVGKIELGFKKEFASFVNLQHAPPKDQY